MDCSLPGSPVHRILQARILEWASISFSFSYILYYHLITIYWLIYVYTVYYYYLFYLPGGSDGKASAYNVGDTGAVPGLGRPPGEGNGNPLQYASLENPMDGEAW